jgi:uncharacterized protein YbbC (DUF1343 family)
MLPTFLPGMIFYCTGTISAFTMSENRIVWCGRTSMRTGCDILSGGGYQLPEGARVGLLANQASVSSSLDHTAGIISRSGAELACLFGPQHGPSGITQANMIEWEGYIDPQLGIPVYSLYGKTRTPLPGMLSGLDILVVDLQDVGARPYTYIWTALLMMRACASAGLDMIVLDRPNPIGGTAVEGPVLEEGYESFVGLWPLPMRHGLTIGEILLAINRGEPEPCTLEIVRMDGWKRDMLFADTELPWVMPSPNVPTPDTALVYPGMVLIEGTNFSEGRGTTRPFELTGAPWIDPMELTFVLESASLPGASFRPAVFRPTFDKFTGEDCGGVQIHITDKAAFRPVLCAVAVIRAVSDLYPEDFRWLDPPYEYETGKPPIDIIYGGPGLREGIDSGDAHDEIASAWPGPLAASLESRDAWLLYE